MRKELVEQLGLTPDMAVIQVKDRKIQPFSIEEIVSDDDFQLVKEGVDHLLTEAAAGNKEAWFAGIASFPVVPGKANKPPQTYRIVFKGSYMSRSLKP